VLRNTNEQRLI